MSIFIATDAFFALKFTTSDVNTVCTLHLLKADLN